MFTCHGCGERFDYEDVPASLGLHRVCSVACLARRAGEVLNPEPPNPLIGTITASSISGTITASMISDFNVRSIDGLIWSILPDEDTGK